MLNNIIKILEALLGVGLILFIANGWWIVIPLNLQIRHIIGPYEFLCLTSFSLIAALLVVRRLFCNDTSGHK